MADLTESFKKATDETKDLLKTWTSVADETERAKKAAEGLNSNSSGSMMTRSTTTSFASAGTNPNGQNPAFGGGQTGNQGYTAFGTNPSNVTGAPRMQTKEDRTNYKELLRNAGYKAADLALSSVAAAAAFMPTTQEAVLNQQLSERLRFYGGAKDTQGAYDVQGQMSSMGTSIGPLDAALASNAGAGMGLLPGLKNFRTTQTKDNPKTKFNEGGVPTGILGSAALISNLVPGSGLQGGMGAVGALNQASSVNMLRMFGIQVRNSDGSQMNDVASVINQLYKILSNGKSDLTEEDIAISAMSGNALDSILRQYFGGDENLRQAVLAGMIQKVKGKSLSKSALMGTGGLSKGTVSTGNRSSAELKLIQNYTAPVTQGLLGANKALTGFYDLLNKGKDNSIVNNLVTGSSAMETFGGARGGAGALLLESLLNGIGGNGVGGLLDSAKAFGAAGIAGVLSKDVAVDPTNMNGFGNPARGATSGQTFNGGITINVSAPPSADPAAFASSISQILTGLT